MLVLECFTFWYDELTVYIIVQLLKKKITVRLLKDEEIKFSANRFLLNKKCLFAKINEHFKLVQGYVFVIMKVTFYENFKALRFNFDEQRTSERRLFEMIFIFFFYLKNRPILISTSHFVDISNIYIFHYELLSIYRHLLFYKRKICYSNFFRIFSTWVASPKYIHFFSDGLPKIFIKRNVNLQFLREKTLILLNLS